ncbi:MAG: type II toxin-antitoxin system HipA family toxin, partial [Rhodospirillales bacterium]
MIRLKRALHLRVYQNNRTVGYLAKEPSGAVTFQYDDEWLANARAFPVSLSMPLREDVYRGEQVNAVFDNLLPDSESLRKQIAERVSAGGTDALNLLTQIGHDCAGALRFLPADADPDAASGSEGDPLDESDIEALINNLAHAPLGIRPEDDFRISIAGAQEKTALLHKEGKWYRPTGTMPTTHIIKTQIGTLPNGIDLKNSVENEHYCMTLAGLFGLPVPRTSVETFGRTKVLVIERFDRRWNKNGRLVRLPQEDCCQALSVPPTQKYQSEGGPGIADILELLKAGDDPARDQQTFLAAQIFFWLIGATDGHAKNFSIFLKPGGAFEMTPLYDILTAQPFADDNTITRRQFRLAMSVGNNRHYRMDEISPRHYLQTASRAGVSEMILNAAMTQIATAGGRAFDHASRVLGDDFPAELHESVASAAKQRLPHV